MKRLTPLLCILLLLTLFFSAKAQAKLPADCTQAIIGIAEGWNSSHVKLSMVEKNAQGQWVRVAGPINARLGHAGLAWGLGVHTNPRGEYQKREGDGRSPAGVYGIGGLWTTTKTPVQHDKRIPELRVGPNDLWISDLSMPKLYNRHVRLKHPARSAWELKEQMRQTDYPHSIKLLIRHNTQETAGRPVVGAGSSIFFHIWRNDGAAATAGCTSMKEDQLRTLIARLRADKNPHYVLLPRAVYQQYRRAWNLP